jgi:hypothetical protein
MNAFIYILQKVTGTEKFINEPAISIYTDIWKDYYTHESNKDKDNSIYWVYNYINSLFYNIHEQGTYECLLCGQCSSIHIVKSPAICSIKNKYDKIKCIMNNVFIDNKTKSKFMNNISKTQRIYRGFSKLVYLYKYKRAETQITTNMMYDEIEPGHRETIELYHEGSRYLFTKYDLSRIINVSLTNSPYYFAEPLVIRNPYNNVPFSKSILYTIYFRMIDNPLKFPILFHNFVWLDFDLDLFRAENECLIREQYFREYIYNATYRTMNNEIRSMLRSQYRVKISIEKDFPVKDLIRIFRPYYYLYLVSQYHICGLEKRKMTADYLSEKLTELYVYNPLFGRKIYYKNKTGLLCEKKFNMDSPKFTMNQAYMYHHLKQQNFSDDETESDEMESDDEYDDNSVS